MKNDNEVGHIFNSNFCSLISRVRAGDSAAEEALLRLIGPLISRIVLKWVKGAAGVDRGDAAQDAIQEIQIHVLEKLRQPKAKGKIPNPEAWIVLVTKNYLKNLYAKDKAYPGDDEVSNSIENPETEDDVPVSGEESPADPQEIAVERGTVTIEGLYGKLPGDLRAGIEKSLDLIVQLFQMRGRLRKDLRHSLRIFKAMEAIGKAERLIARNEKLVPKSQDLQRFLNLKYDSPLLLGTPDGGRTEEERRAEMDKIKEKFGENELSVALLLDEAQTLLDLNVVDSLSLDLTSGYLLHDYAGTWEDHLPEIARMKVSPPSIIYKVWSKAPGFSMGRLGKYRSRKRISLAFHYHKQASRGTPREVLFRNIKVEPIEGMEKSIEQFRKVGYGQALQKKYRRIIDLIYRESFKEKTISHGQS